MKSHAKFRILCRKIFLDFTARCATEEVEFERDLKTIESRLEHEGLSFLTITLPNFCQGIERSLEEGKVTHGNFPGWKFTKSLPSFLKGLTSAVFDLATGTVLMDPCPISLEHIRQLTLMFKKILVDCTPDRVTKSLKDFIKTEHDLQSTMLNPDSLETFIKVSKLLWGNMFSDFKSDDLLPKHGPGSTEERIYGNRKYVHRTWTERLQPFFPYDSYACFNVEHAIESVDSVSFLALEEEKPVRVIPVPKTLKGPRIIAIEPVCMQYTQQAVSGYIIPKIEKHYITSGHINFSDQNVNKCLAISSSKDRKLASLDLSSASDRVPLSLVLEMLKSTEISEWILASRSRRAKVLGEVITLSKFASMGSALCFPIEAMYFFTVILSALLDKYKLPVTLRNIYKMSRNVYVYGDDLFVPTDEVDFVTETLTSFYCKVNVHKSFWKSNFRESCGMDVYNGHNVTPIYVRRIPPSNKGSVNEIISWVSTSNLFYKRGYWHTASFMKDCVETIMGNLPIVHETSPSLGFVSYTKCYTVNRYNKRLHRPEVLGHVVVPVYRTDKLHGYNAMVKWILSRNCPTKIDYTKTPRSGTVRIQRRWTTPF